MKPSASARIAETAAALNERQRAYLLVAYDEDQYRAKGNRSFGASPARVWRWMEYGPDKPILLHKPDGVLREQLRQRNLVDNGSGSTWRSLAERQLIELEYRHAFARVSSLFVQMTRDGRSVARVLRPDADAAPAKAAGALSLTALRLIAHGQQHPSMRFDIQAPWPDGYPADFMVLRMIARSLVKRGLCAGDDWTLQITAEGLKLDVTAQPNWVSPRQVPPLPTL